MRRISSRMGRVHPAIAGVALLAVLAVGVGEAATLYVDDDGACGGNSPCYTTIQAAIDAAFDGDTIEVSAGDYAEQVVVRKSLTITGEDPATTSLTCSGRTEQVVFLGTNSGMSIPDGVVFEGFTLTPCPDLFGDSDLIKLRASGTDATPIVIRGNVFACAPSDQRTLGIEESQHSNHLVIADNEFHDCTYGMWLNQPQFAEVTGNLITGATFASLAICTSETDANAPHDLYVAGNTIEGTTTYESPPDSFGPWLAGMHIGSTGWNMTFEGNTIRDGNYHGFYLHDRGSTNLTEFHLNCNNIHDNGQAGHPDNTGNKSEVPDDVILDALHNWWGDPSGPFHPSLNPDGTGDEIGEGFAFEPWSSSIVVSAASCPSVQVILDLRPGTTSNQINTNAKQLVPIAILGTADFDPPSQVDITSIIIHGGEPSTTKFDEDDVDGDGYRDLTMYFRANGFRKPDPETECGNPEATVEIEEGITTGGTALTGADSVVWLGPDCK